MKMLRMSERKGCESNAKQLMRSEIIM